jgi:diguanylate cyclase (GGDEF)-like protein
MGHDGAMSTPPLALLVVGAADDLTCACAAAGWTVTQADTAAEASRHDAVLLRAPTRQALAALRQQPGLAQAAFDSAVVVLTEGGDDDTEADLLRLGVEALVAPGDPVAVQRAIRHAVERKRAERVARTAYATDLATGLPHQAQLLEHMTQLLALREREPAPMVLIVLRVQGYAGTAAQLGREAANILRRKVAVRLRGALRASDVVAAIGPDAFGVLLGRLEAPADGERVAAKLERSLQQPFVVSGQPCAVAAAVGLAHYPEHGRDAGTLLQRARAQAGVAATARDGDGVRGPGPAANDESA